MFNQSKNILKKNLFELKASEIVSVQYDVCCEIPWFSDIHWIFKMFKNIVFVYDKRMTITESFNFIKIKAMNNETVWIKKVPHFISSQTKINLEMALEEKTKILLSSECHSEI